MFSEDVIVGYGNVELTVRDYGGTHDRAIVLLHGLSSNLEIWHLVAPFLAQKFRVVAYDQRNHGRSGDADGEFGFPALAADLEAVIREKELEAPVVVGHSWGASVALTYAGDHPETPGVVCVDGGVFDLQAMGANWEQTAEMLRPPRLIGPADEIIARIRTEQEFLPWESLEPVVLRSRVEIGDGLTGPRLPMDEHMRIVREMWEQPTLELHDRVRCPVLLVLARGVERNNREQGFVAVKQLAAERISERNPRATIEWLESVHDVPIASPAELTQLIEGFATAE